MMKNAIAKFAMHFFPVSFAGKLQLPYAFPFLHNLWAIIKDSISKEKEELVHNILKAASNEGDVSSLPVLCREL